MSIAICLSEVVIKKFGDDNGQKVLEIAGLPNAHPPEFWFEQPAPNKLVMKYASSRRLGDVFVGLVKGVRKAFREELRLRSLGPNSVEITFAR